MKKKKSIKTLKKKADAVFSRYVRLRDSTDGLEANCITCGVKKPIKELQAGHFVSRKVNILRYDDENVNIQCISCNVMKYGEQYQYAKELDMKYGDGTADKLHQKRFTSHKFTSQELEQIIKDAEQAIDELHRWYRDPKNDIMR